MPLIRVLLNNSFWIALLLLFVALYIFYNTPPTSTQTIENSAPTLPAEIRVAPSNLASQQSAATPDSELKPDVNSVAQTTAANDNLQNENATPPIAEEASPLIEPSIAEAPIFPGDVEMEQILESDSSPANSTAQTAEILPKQLTPAELQQQIQLLLQQARIAVEQNDLQTAQNRYTQLLQIQPNANLLGEIANQLYRLGYHEMAEYAWVEAFNFLLYEQRPQEAQQLSAQLRKLAPQAYRMIIQQHPQYSATPRAMQPTYPAYPSQKPEMQNNGQYYGVPYTPNTPQQ
ncbi:hypothetical protein THMIRHAS_05730 [Thiosulfatimonas sediminis]|uniref:Tetratricopeptide repeat protein n=1 Tax=Thiosulfatimonas sediminis TaxID=2675054 RepID=A0A6F8PT87_9GAMM|nr:hypothetical protein [Thiosulfatimonas sediminis]BBP45200.1 hypothetical protein THMIRHAS_05730 [Thiosulfatimonas sediminis]